MKRRKLKHPNDYPLIAFRVLEQSIKDEIDREVKVVLKLYNKDLREGDKRFRKNDILVEAIRKGLKQLKRQKE